MLCTSQKKSDFSCFTMEKFCSLYNVPILTMFFDASINQQKEDLFTCKVGFRLV